MKVVLVNGSPRKNWNTHRLLAEAEKGAREAGAETQLIHLFDLDFKDCRSCFTCKRRGNQTDGICAIRDGLRPVYEAIADADGLVIGSPVYFGNLTGEVISFINRLQFPLMHYEYNDIELLKKKKRCGLIVTMNMPESTLMQSGYAQHFDEVSQTLGSFLGSCEALYACDTYQFDDYSRYYAGMFDAKHKAEHRDQQFPIDLARAHDLGRRIAEARP